MVRRLALSGLLFALMAVIPANVAAAGCQLTATPDPGRSVAVVGSGFDAGTTVTLDMTRNGTADSAQTLQADASGAFNAAIDAGPGRGGDYVFTAVSAGCSATAEAVAVETAGGPGGNVQPSVPPTYTVGVPADDPGTPSRLAGLLLATLAVVVLVTLRVAARGRSSVRR